MHKRRLGRSDLLVPVIGLGTWKVFDVNGLAEEERCAEVATTAIKAEANFFDSSPMYGEAERVLGQAIRAERKHCYIATKVWTRNGQYSADEQIAASLRYFGDVIDVYQIHNLSEWEPVLDKLEVLKADGKVKSIGITHYQEEAFPEMMKVMRTGRIDTIQVPYNALRESATQEILPFAQELDLGVIIMEPLESGALVRTSPPAEALKPFERFGCYTWAQALLKFVVSDPLVHIAIPATSSPQRMEENAAAGGGEWMDESAREEVRRLAEYYCRL